MRNLILPFLLPAVTCACLAEAVVAKPTAATDRPAVYERRHDEGPETLLPRARAGDLKAMLELSEVYAWAYSDFKSSIHWLRRAADAGYAPAQFTLGMALGLGDSVVGRLKVERVEGLTWLILAARQPDPRQQALGIAYVVRRSMTAPQIAEAERRARAWVAKPAK